MGNNGSRFVQSLEGAVLREWDLYRGRIILVTGGAGAIGHHLVCRLADAGAAKVIVLDDLSSGFAGRIPRLENVSLVTGSVANRKTLRRVFAERPSLVFHLAALFANQNSVDHPERDLAINGLGTLCVLQEAVLHRVQRVVYTASSSSHPQFQSSSSRRSGDLSTPYQITKLLGEMYCRYFSKRYGMEVCCARLFNSYGPGELPGRYRNVIPNWIYLALKGEALPVAGTGDETRDFTFVTDHVAGLLHAGVEPAAADQTLDFGTGIETPVLELARLVNQLTSNRAGECFVEARKWDCQTRRVADVTRCQSLLGCKAQVPIDVGLARTVAWFQANWHRISKIDWRPALTNHPAPTARAL